MKCNFSKYRLFLIIGLGLLTSACNKTKPADREYLNQHGKLAIGVYLGRTVENKKTTSVVYEYDVKNQIFQNSDKECFLDSDKAKNYYYFSNFPLLKGNEFVILYDSLNPETSIIRLDYPLRDSTDFKSYKRKFQELRTKK